MAGGFDNLGMGWKIYSLFMEKVHQTVRLRERKGSTDVEVASWLQETVDVGNSVCVLGNRLP